MVISRGDATVFYNSLVKCLKDIDEVIQVNNIASELSVIRNELDCMKTVIERLSEPYRSSRI